MDTLNLAAAVLSTLFRVVAYIFLRIIPSPIARTALPVLLVAQFTALFLAPKISNVPQVKVEQPESKEPLPENGLDVKQDDPNGAAAVPPPPPPPQTRQEQDQWYRTIALSLPSPSPRLRKANLAINALLALMALEFTLTPFLDTAADLSFSRIGAVSADSVKIAVRFPTVNATAQLLFREQKEDAENPNPWRSGPSLVFSPETDFVHTVKLSGLWPNTLYEYALADENRTVTSGPFAFRTFPDSRLSTGSRFRFVASSCVIPNFPYLPFHARTIRGFDLLANYLYPATAPIDPIPPVEFMLFLGDFIYADVPTYTGDSKEAYRRLYRRNYQSKSFKKIYERLPIFHTYDDHEFKNNYIGFGNDSQPPFPSASDAFKIYNADANYDSVGDQHYYSFRYDDAAFFVLDTRRYRVPATEDAPAGTMLGETQLAALHSWLAHANGTSSFKFIVSSVPFTSLWGHDAQVDSWAAFPAEKAALLEALHSVPNVVIISGDRHEFAAIQYNTPHMHPVYEYSTSPLSMFDIPLVRTLSMQSEETVPANRSELVETEEGPVYVTETVQVPKERVLKYVPLGNVKWSTFEIDSRDLNRPVLRLELVINGKTKYQEELVGHPVKLQASNALGVFVSTGIKDVFNRIGIKPSRWF
ncbi:alkaline phosphatase D [Favolaschia claudopus]|uniref:Alkaline phosphatase D n=1 Tax=Favolaschia claudopus TaxID=2862362 RepID=A0AAW0BCL8_9AGAR